ncbi:hypothetical protein DFH07DRAFT_787353 [Mycena maculata]|uniref:Uncharacterized protein n=1 Tax=Mycena maculata TaxID=230809 RepID=A0AAD7KGU8_9AGAR|nr:hypothetical protein DFH07DRAFT_787353 [Mycena maculata]
MSQTAERSPQAEFSVGISSLRCMSWPQPQTRTTITASRRHSDPVISFRPPVYMPRSALKRTPAVFAPWPPASSLDPSSQSCAPQPCPCLGYLPGPKNTTELMSSSSSAEGNKVDGRNNGSGKITRACRRITKKFTAMMAPAVTYAPKTPRVSPSLPPPAQWDEVPLSVESDESDSDSESESDRFRSDSSDDSRERRVRFLVPPPVENVDSESSLRSDSQ